MGSVMKTSSIQWHLNLEPVSPEQLDRKLDDAARTRARNLPESSRSHRRIRTVEVDLVKCIEKLTAELRPHPLADRELAHEGDVGVKQGRAVNEIPPGVAVSSQRHLGQWDKGGRIEELVDERVPIRMRNSDVAIGRTGN